MAIDATRAGTKGRRPSNRNGTYQRVSRGQEITQAWPKARGKNLHPKTKAQMEFFRQVQWAFKFSAPAIQRSYAEAVHGTPLLPRDLFLMAAAGRMHSVIDTNGQRWWSVAAIQNVSDSLDVLAQLPGQMLIRRADRWAALDAGTDGYVLTTHGDGNLPTWELAGPPPGHTFLEVTNTPYGGDWGTGWYLAEVPTYGGVGAIAPDSAYAIFWANAGQGAIEVYNSKFDEYYTIGERSAAGRNRHSTYGRGVEFDEPPFVGSEPIYSGANLIFGSGLTYNAVTGELTATGGGGGGTPTIRSSAIQSSSAASYNVNWPAGTVAGDVVIIFGAHGFALTTPAGWSQLDNQAGSNVNGLTIAKIMTSADITAGHVTIAAAGGFNGSFAAVTIDGATMTGLRSPNNFVRSSSGPAAGAATTLSQSSAESTDTIIAYAGTRATSNVTFSSGITSLQAINAASASAALGHFTGSLSPLGMNETWQSSAAGSGYYTSAIALK